MTSLCEVAFEDGESDPNWCVDLNFALCAMTSEELWWAAATGRVGRETRAWRLGLEAWEKLSNIPEIAAAFEPESANETAATPPAVEITALPAPHTGVGANSSPVWDREDVIDADQPWQGTIMSWVRGLVLETRWILSGAAVGVAAIALSLAGTMPPPPVTVAKASASSAVAGTVIAAAEAMAPRRPVSERASATSRAEAGQRRLRAGRNQARGR